MTLLFKGVRAISTLVTPLAVFALPMPALAGTNYLGSAQSFAVLGASTVTSTGPSLITGSVGVWAGTAITGFPPGLIFDGALHLGDAVAQQAQADLTIAYNTFADMAVTSDLTGQDLGGMTLPPGVYHFESSALLSSTLTLDALGDPNALFVFQIGSTLTTASASSVLTINDASGCNVYWQIGSSATIGTATEFTGNMLAMASITLNSNAKITEGRALARNGAVTLISNTIEIPDKCPQCPADLNDDGTVDGLDLAILLGSWNPTSCPVCVADINGDGVVDGSDLAIVLGAWGPCP